MKGPPGRQGDLEFFAHQACPVQGAERGGAVPAKTEATSRCPGGSVSVKQVLFPADQSALNVNRKPTRRDVLVRPPRHTVVHLDGYVSLPGTPPQAGAHATSGTHLPRQWLQVAAGDLSRPASGQAGSCAAGFTSHFSRVVRAPSTAQWLLPDDLGALLLPLALAGLGGVSVPSCFPSGF